MLKIDELNIFFFDNFNYLKSFFDKINYSKLFILVDNNTNRYCLPIIKDFLPKFNLIQINEGEENKNINSCEIIWNELLKNNADRKSLLINLGGGIVSDIGAFCAATYKRGINFINIPTTLLSQVDASVGGKCAINFNDLKNTIGLFINPEYVFIIKDFLKTLSKREYYSGLAEMIKHSLIDSEKSFNRLIENYNNLSIEDIYNSVKIKYSIVKKDFKEKGIRKILNFGHTIGHALETISIKTNRKLLHGEAISIGMICELYISNKVINTDLEIVKYISYKIIDLFGYFDIHNYDINDILTIISNDKKNFNNKTYFSLLKEIGNIIYDIEVPTQVIIDSIEYYKSFF